MTPLLATAALQACIHGPNAVIVPRSTYVVSPCTQAAATSSGAGSGSIAEPSVASLRIALVTSPAAPADAEATVRIQGEDNYRADITMNAAAGTLLQLPRGIYDLRIRLDGYDGVAPRVTLTPGCSAELAVKLGK